MQRCGSPHDSSAIKPDRSVAEALGSTVVFQGTGLVRRITGHPGSVASRRVSVGTWVYPRSTWHLQRSQFGSCETSRRPLALIDGSDTGDRSRNIPEHVFDGMGRRKGGLIKMTDITKWIRAFSIPSRGTTAYKGNSAQGSCPDKWRS